jgi:hypothetical protein
LSTVPTRLTGSCLDLASPTRGRILAAFICSLSADAPCLLPHGKGVMLILSLVAGMATALIYWSFAAATTSCARCSARWQGGVPGGGPPWNASADGCGSWRKLGGRRLMQQDRCPWKPGCNLCRGVTWRWGDPMKQVCFLKHAGGNTRKPGTTSPATSDTQGT